KNSPRQQRGLAFQGDGPFKYNERRLRVLFVRQRFFCSDSTTPVTPGLRTHKNWPASPVLNQRLDALRARVAPRAWFCATRVKGGTRPQAVWRAPLPGLSTAKPRIA